MSERYKIIFQARLLSEQDIAGVKQRLSRILKTDEENLGALFDGDRWLIRNNIDLPTARRYETAFASAGAKCTIEDVSPAPPPDIQEDAESDEFEILSFEPYPFCPFVFSMPVSEAVKDGDRNTVFHIISKKPIFGRLFSFLIGSLIAFFLEILLMPHLAERLGTSDAVSFLGAGLYFAGIYLFYSLLTGRKHIAFYTDTSESSPFMEMLSRRMFKTGYDAYELSDERGEKIGTLKKDGYRNIYESYAADGLRICTAERHLKMNKVATDAVLTIREYLFESRIIDVLQAMIQKRLMPLVRSVLGAKISDMLPEEFAKDREKRLFLIRKENGILAECKIWKTCELKILNTADGSADKRLIIALGVLLSGL